jgi:hypothetical protein
MFLTMSHTISLFFLQENEILSISCGFGAQQGCHIQAIQTAQG